MFIEKKIEKWIYVSKKALRVKCVLFIEKRIKMDLWM